MAAPKPTRNPNATVKPSASPRGTNPTSQRAKGAGSSRSGGTMTRVPTCASILTSDA
jgi:hypothetical protein